MWLKPDDYSVVTSWTNSHKAVVHLLHSSTEGQLIKKVYRPRFAATMVREYLVATYAARRLSIVPRVLGFHPRQRALYFSYISGQRVLEWVLQRFGHDLVLSEFQSSHGLDPPDHVDGRIADAFARFRESQSTEARRLKQAIKRSYASLHHIAILHGSADPRNAIYDDDRVFIIDFDHARPSLNAARIEYKSLIYWYGLLPDE